MEIKKIIKDISLSFVFTVLATVLGYGMRSVFAKNLSIQDYGLFYAVLGFFAFFAIFRTLGTSDSIIHFIPKYSRYKNKDKLNYAISVVFKLQFILGIISAIIFFIFAKPIAIYFFHMEQAAVLIQIQAIAFFVIGFAEVFASIFRGFQKNYLATAYDPIRLLVVMIGAIILIKMNLFDAKNLMILWLLGYVFLTLVYFIIFKIDYGIFVHEIKKTKNHKTKKSVIEDIRKYSMPLLFGVAAELIISKTDILILTLFKGVNDVAFYEVAFPASRLMMVFVSPFLFILFPLVSKFFFEKQKTQIKEILQMAYNTGIFLLVPIAALLIMYPELVIKTVFTPEYLSAANALRIMTVGMFFLVFAQINFNILSGIGEIKSKTKILYTVAIYNIIMDLILIPPYGYMGAIIVTSSSFFLLWILSHFICVKHVNFNLNLGAIAKIAVCLGIFLLSVITLKSYLVLNIYLEAVIVSTISFLIYLMLGVFVFKIVKIDRLRELYKAARK